MNDIKKLLFMITLNIVLLATIIKASISLMTSSTFVGILDIILIFSVLYLYLTNRYLSLPFLSEAVLPMTAIADEKIPVLADLEYTLNLDNVKDGVKVIYWGAQKDKDSKIYDNPYEAYDKYENVGIAIVKDNKATLKYSNPSEYKVNGRQLPRHLHYRLCCKNNVMLSEVVTIILD